MYIHAFGHLPFGGPDAWAEFGDYFGGVVSPFVGIAAAWLVYLTVHVTMKESEVTREKMQGQIDLLVDQQRLTDLHRRLEGLYEVWNRHIHTNRFTGFVGGTDEVLIQSPHDESFASIFSNEDYRKASVSFAALPGPDITPKDLKRQFAEAAEFLTEMDVALEMYAQLARNPDLTDFYRLRMWKAAVMLKAWSLIDASIRDRFIAAHDRLEAVRKAG
jgi:hypothetical protein